MSKIADFRNERNFPTLISCPHEDSINLDYFNVIADCLYPKRHWCLFAEIVEAGCSLRPRMIVRDTAGTAFPIAFHLPNNTKPRAWEDFQPGISVAILYPLQHGCKGCTMEIIQEMADGIQVDTLHDDAKGKSPELTLQLIPLRLPDLLALNDKIQAQNIKHGGKLACHSCGERKVSLDKCGRCGLFWYCNKVRYISLRTQLRREVCFSNMWPTPLRHAKSKTGTRDTKKIAKSFGTLRDSSR